MSDVSFDIWMSAAQASEFQQVLKDNAVSASSSGRLQQRSVFTQPTVIIAVSGAAYQVAKAFTAYFQSREKCIKVSDGDRTFYVKNYTPTEVLKIAKAGNHIVLTDKPNLDSTGGNQ